MDRVLIVGAGIGGLALAAAIGRDFDVAAFARRVWGELAKPY